MRHIRLFSIISAVVLLCSACAASTSGGTSSSLQDNFGQVYKLYYDSAIVYMNQSGNIITEEAAQRDTVYDALTGEPAYYTRTRYVATGEYDEWKVPAAETWQALYSLDGELICDWQLCRYDSAIGGLVARHTEPVFREGELSVEDAHAALINPATGKIIIDDVCTLSKFTDDSVMALDYAGMLLGMLDADGNKLAGFPAPVEVYYPSIGNGYFSAYDESSRGTGAKGDTRLINTLYDKDFNILLSGRYYLFGCSWASIEGDYVCYLKHEDGEFVILSLPDLQPVYTAAAGVSVDYFDGEHIVLCDYSSGRWLYTLHDANGNMISGPYTDLTPSRRYGISDDEIGDFLIAYDDTVLKKIDYDGNVYASREIENVYNISIGSESLYICMTNEDITTPGGTSVYMLDENFNTVAELEGYCSIRDMTDEAAKTDRQLNRYLAQKNMNDETYGMYTYDLLDENGSVLVSDIASVGTITRDAFAVRRGFSVGLMDPDGNWISEHSIYDVLRTD